MRVGMQFIEKDWYLYTILQKTKALKIAIETNNYFSRGPKSNLKDIFATFFFPACFQDVSLHSATSTKRCFVSKNDQK